MLKLKRSLRKQEKREHNWEKKTTPKRRRKLIEEHIMNEQKQQRASKIVATVDRLRKDGGGFSETTFWEFKRSLEKKKVEPVSAMRNEEGERKESKAEIIEIYERFYTKMFEKKVACSEDERNNESRINRKLEEITTEAKEQLPLKISQEKIRKQISKLKNKKAKDSDGWKNEMIKYGGEEMMVSIWKMTRKILNENEVPAQWERMTIKSIYKNKGRRDEMSNRRGIFLTSVVSKLFERKIMQEVEIDLTMSEYQNGGRKGRSVTDNWVVLMAIVDNNKRLKRNTYMVMADAENCFDKLWLEDYLVDLNKAGAREREVELIRKLNERARIKILTPSGESNEITIERIVKQGTVFGPQLCCINSQSINEMTEDTSNVILPGVIIKAMTYVNDINGTGTKQLVEKVGKNLAEMEKMKKYTFNNKNGKSHYLIVKSGREGIEELNIEVEKGKISRAEEYKYLGNMITESWTIERQVEEVYKKVKGMLVEAKRIGNEISAGKFSSQVLLTIYEKTMVPVITYNLETWTDVRKKDMDKLEKIQAECVKSLWQLPVSTPYWWLLNEFRYDGGKGGLQEINVVP